MSILFYVPFGATTFAAIDQQAEQDRTWLETWAKAVVHASKTDQAERLDANPKSTRRDNRTRSATRRSSYDGGEDGVRHDGAAPGEANFDEESVQARRRAMKSAVRKRYAFSTTAQLWAGEITGAESRMLGSK